LAKRQRKARRGARKAPRRRTVRRGAFKRRAPVRKAVRIITWKVAKRIEAPKPRFSWFDSEEE
jgi:hypothetical protein